MRFISKLGLFAVVLVVFLELFFRFGVHASEKPAYFVDSETNLALFDMTQKQNGTYTWGRLPLSGGQWQLNNDGWLSIFDYQSIEEKTRPRVAIIGDSYIASLSTDMESHLDALLKEDFAETADFYSYGMGGQYLEQYRHLLDLIDKQHDPDVYVFFVNNMDIQSSLTNFGRYSMYYQLKPVENGFEEVVPQAFRESGKKKFARKSALALYLRINAGITAFGGGRGIADANANPDQPHDDISLQSDPLLVDATSFILDRMLEGRENKQFIFAADGQRHLLYQGEPNPRPYEDCTLIQAACETRPQCHYLDLMTLFKKEFEKEGKWFNHEDNFHWNEYGTEIVAQSVATFLKDHQILLD